MSASFILQFYTVAGPTKKKRSSGPKFCRAGSRNIGRSACATLISVICGCIYLYGCDEVDCI